MSVTKNVFHWLLLILSTNKCLNNGQNITSANIVQNVHTETTGENVHSETNIGQNVRSENIGEIVQTITDVNVTRYCNKVFDLIDRTDESYENCRWLDVNTVSIGDLSQCDGGVICDRECVPYHLWCDPDSGTPEVTTCGAIIYSPDICRNRTFWAEIPCGGRGSRCGGWWPGQCDTGLGCRDGSHRSSSAGVVEEEWCLD